MATILKEPRRNRFGALASWTIGDRTLLLQSLARHDYLGLRSVSWLHLKWCGDGVSLLSYVGKLVMPFADGISVSWLHHYIPRHTPTERLIVYDQQPNAIAAAKWSISLTWPYHIWTYQMQQNQREIHNSHRPLSWVSGQESKVK